MRKGTFVKTIVIACCILANLAMAIDIPARHKKNIMSEVVENGSAYLRRQMAYASSLKHQSDGSWDEIGFEPANCVRDSAERKWKEYCHTKYFRFTGTEGIDAPRSGVKMELMDSLYGCPAGSYWEVFVFWGKPAFHEPDNIDCIKLLPNFKNIVNDYKKTDDAIEIASVLQSTFAALFFDLTFDYNRSTVANLWPETQFIALVDSSLLKSKIKEKEEFLMSDSMSSFWKIIHEQIPYQDSVEGCNEKCAKKMAALIVEANFHETEWFEFEEIPAYMEIIFRRIRTGMRAVLKKDLDGCPAGSSWEGFLVADIEHLNDIAGPRRKNLCREIRSPRNESCAPLTPHIYELNTCKSDIWDAELQFYRAQMLSDHRDSVNRYKEFYKDSVRKQEIADSIMAYEKYKTCISNGEDSAKCYRYSVPYISWSSFDVEKYDISTPLNVWKTLGLDRKERDKGK